MSLTTEGFVRPRLNELKADYDQRVIAALGPVNTNADSVVGQLIGIFSAALDDAYESLQNTYDSMYPHSAEGTSLDGAVEYVGLERLAAAPTVVTAMCYGTESTLVPAGALVRATDNRQYASSVDSVISRASAGDVSIEVASVLNVTGYQIIANGVSHLYTSDASATAEEITAGLAALFSSTDFLAIATSGVLRLRSADQYSDFTLTIDSKLAITILGTPVVFTALEMGAYSLPANALTAMDSSVAGWDSVNNLVEGATGRFVESDAELRERHLGSVRAAGSATLQSIRARLRAEVDSVSYVSIYENRTDTVDAFSLPPHSFETVVEGGSSQAIADKLFILKPAGIETYGNVSVNVTDENGDTQVCKFSRASDKFAWIRVTVDSLNAEETLTAEVAQAIKDAVVSYGQSIGIGSDIITQRFFGPVYSATSGIGAITVEAAITALETDVPTYSEANVVVARTERALFDLTRVVVVGV